MPPNLRSSDTFGRGSCCAKTKPRQATKLRFITFPPLGVSIVITPLSLRSVANTRCWQLQQRVAANIAAGSSFELRQRTLRLAVRVPTTARTETASGHR
jgi:hypothetical protein